MARSSSRTSAVSADIRRHSQRPATRPGPGISPLHIGDPDFQTPQFIVDALDDALAQGYTHYAPPQGDPDLRAALAVDLSVRSGTTIEATQIVVTGGGSPAISSAILAAVNVGDRVLIPNPTYSLYADSARMAGGVPEFLPPGTNGRIDLPALEAQASNACMVVLCQPGNPTGQIFTRDELEEIGAIANRHNLLVLSDEAYDRIVFDDSSFVSTLEIESMASRLIYCQTFSKTFAMTGWRVGYIAAPPDIASAVAVIHRTFSGPVNSAVQRAALAAVLSHSSWPYERLLDYERRRDLSLRYLADVPGIHYTKPAGAFYVFLSFAQKMTSEAFVGHAMDFGVGVRSGSEFGPAGEGYIRMAFCVEDSQLEIGLDRLRAALTSEPLSHG